MLLCGASNIFADNEFVSLMTLLIQTVVFKAYACDCVREFYNLLELLLKKSLIEREVKIERDD